MLRIFRIDRVFRPGNGWRAAVALMGLAVLVCASCQTTEAWQKPVDDREAAARLAALHGEGGAAVGGGGREAVALAAAAAGFAREAPSRYRIAGPSWFHNVKVNLRVREAGLCWHQMEDLFLTLARLDPQWFDLHSGVRDQGDWLREHHAVVVTAVGEPFESGLVLDPWKSPGRLLVHRARGDGRPWVENKRHRMELEAGRRLPWRGR